MDLENSFDIQREEAAARATVALTRAKELCVILGPLNMLGLIGAATVVGSLMYGVGICWRQNLELHHQHEEAEAGIDDYIWPLWTPGGRNGFHKNVAQLRSAVREETAGPLTRNTTPIRLTSSSGGHQHQVRFVYGYALDGSTFPCYCSHFPYPAGHYGPLDTSSPTLTYPTHTPHSHDFQRYLVGHSGSPDTPHTLLFSSLPGLKLSDLLCGLWRLRLDAQISFRALIDINELDVNSQFLAYHLWFDYPNLRRLSGHLCIPILASQWLGFSTNCSGHPVGHSGPLGTTPINSGISSRYPTSHSGSSDTLIH